MDKRGFTLLELLLAVVILAMVISTVYYGIAGTTKVYNTIEAESYLYRLFRTFAERFIDDVESIVQVGGVKSFLNLENNITVLFKGADTERTQVGVIVTMVSDPFCAFGEEVARKGPMLISYELAQNSGRSAYNLIRHSVPIVGKTKERHDIILPDVKSIRMEYIDESKQVRKDWDSTLEENLNKVPKFVKLTIVLDGSQLSSQDLTHEITVAPILVGK